MSKRNYKDNDQLFEAILLLNSLDEAQRFFSDLLTPQEVEEFAARWRVAQMLNKKKSYSSIEKETGMSSTTIARISKFLNGTYGGYKNMIEKINNTNHHVPV